MMNFSQAVYEIVKDIPRGRVISYGEIARMLGNPRGARMVGWAMSRCPEGLPWHRVVMADGKISGGDFADLRRAMLEDEDVIFLPDGRVDMKRCGV
ncbi:MAG: MGMT family protein [Defluviitaleaceae bacterium]|nr:MGMT family protein [Defluviitaleaceae bacterium]